MVLDNAWGALPVAVPLLIFVAHRVSQLVFAHEDRAQQAAGTVVLGMTLVHASVGVLGQLGLVSGGSLLLVLAIAAVALVAHRRTSAHSMWPGRDALPALALGGLTLALAVLSARLLPVWQWDAFGYHLPFVNFVLQSGGFSGVPDDVRYISTYPHNVELGMIWLRAMLPDDRLVDLAQVPYGAAGAVLSAALARRFGASRALALLAGAAWLTLPAVFLQLPTNYVDVGTATALLGAIFFLIVVPVTPRALIVGGLALGLFLGSKPSAPLATALLGAVAVIRATRAGQLRSVPVFGLLTLIFGAEMYVVMTLRHGNPIWPVVLQLGPVSLPGTFSVNDLLAAGAATPRASGTLLERLSVSWLALDSLPVFDMRLGGFGVVSLLALPLGLLGLLRRRSGWLVLAVVATLLSPDPSVARYVLAFPALLLALAMAEVTRMPRAASSVAMALVVVTGCWQLVRAVPGLSGDGPPWWAFIASTDDERRVALGPNGRPNDYPPAWAMVGHGESMAFDTDFEFPGLLWDPQLNYPVYAVPDTLDAAWLDARQVRVLAVGPQHRDVIDRDPSRWKWLFDCRSAECAVFARVDAEEADAVSATGSRAVLSQTLQPER